MLGERTKSDLLEEKRRLLSQRWESLPIALRTETQLAGKVAVACGATHHVMERCDFACTCCYLGPHANETEPLPFEEVKEQLDLLRSELGIGGKVQITAGEVTLLPLEDLGRIVAYSNGIGLDTMVMTHGQRFLEEPGYLKSLMARYGLRKVSIHVDATQRGRRGVARGLKEVELNTVRENFAKLIRRVRAETKRDLKVASTITVTEDILGELSEVVDWFFENADAFRLLSFQPVANVGRTLGSHNSTSIREAVWEQVNLAAGRPLNREAMNYGHPSCNLTVPLILVQIGNRRVIFEGIREGNVRDQRMFSDAMRTIGSRFDTTQSYGEDFLVFSRMLLRSPGFAFRTFRYGFRRLWEERTRLAEIVGAVVRLRRWPRMNPFLFVVHSFMDGKELASAEGKERLEACVFKVPVDGKLVSMCEMNASDLREQIDARLNRASFTEAAKLARTAHSATNRKG